MGISSGPSSDGVDVSVIAIEGRGPAMRVRQVAEDGKLYPESLRRRIRAICESEKVPPAVLAELDADSAVAMAKTAEMLLSEAEIPADRIEAVGLGGPSVALRPPSVERAIGGSVELGNAALIARRLGRPVVSRFSEADFAAGGMGGPITAWADWLLLRDERLSRVCVHLGAVAELTFIPADADPADVRAFDVGPGTAVIDELIHRYHHRIWDADGAIASAGRANPELLNELMAQPFFQEDPPRRTHVGQWLGAFIWRLLNMAQKRDCTGADLVATATELTARTVAQAVRGLTERPHEVILTGGGAKNIHLAGRIRKLLSPSSTYTIERYGFSLQTRRAACLAVLAAARMDGYPAHCPAAGGAESPAVLGGLTRPPESVG